MAAQEVDGRLREALGLINGLWAAELPMNLHNNPEFGAYLYNCLKALKQAQRYQSEFLGSILGAATGHEVHKEK